MPRKNNASRKKPAKKARKARSAPRTRKRRKKISTTRVRKLAGKHGKLRKIHAAPGPMSQAARELEIFVENDRDLYRQMDQPIRKNLMTKRARGEYVHGRAVDAFVHLADAGARKYAAAEGGGVTPWHKMFSTADRRQVAESLASSFEAEADLGNYDYLLPVKYQAKASGAEKSSRQIEQEVEAIAHDI